MPGDWKISGEDYMIEECRGAGGTAGEKGAGEGLGSLSRPGMLGITGLFLLLYLPFVNKAFHIDDFPFIMFSRMIGWNPFQAMPIDYDYIGVVLPQFLPYDTTHPILVPYFIKIVTALFGENEVALHLAFMIFPLIALFSLMKLNTVLFPGARRTAVILAAFFCTLPAFLVNAETVMTDVPTLTFLLLAMAGFFDGLENGSRGMIWLGSAALTLSLFCSYQMLAFVVLLFFYAFLRRKLTLRMAAAIALPLLILTAWLLVIYEMYDVFPLLKTKLPKATASIADEIMKGQVHRTLVHKVFSIFGFIGAVMLWVVPFHYALKRTMGKFVLLFLPLLVASYLAIYRLTGYPFATNLFFAALVALGLLAVITLSWMTWQRVRQRDDAWLAVFLLIWVYCVIGYCIALIPFSSARYLLPAFPPALMLLLNDPAWSFTTQGRRIGLACVLGGTVLFALASAYSDYRLADTYRDFAARTRAFRASGGNTFNVWYIGEWGMHYYMDKAGARYLHADSTEPKAGDYLIDPVMPNFWKPEPSVQERLNLFDQQEYRSWLPLRLFNGRSHAGFYAHFWGMLPFAFSSEPDEVFSVYKIVR